MTIAEIGRGSKACLGRIPRDVLVLSVLILSSSASFGLGILAGKDMALAGQGSAFSIAKIPMAAAADPAAAATTSFLAGGQVVASKSGTKYFLPWCAGAAQIKEANKVWFASAAAAQAAGYGPAANCKGL